MDYSLITEKDLETRYNYLPSKLKALLDSEDILLKLDTISNNNHIQDDEKRIKVIQLFSFVLLGVLHVEDLAGEIDRYLSLNNYKFSKAFAEEITNKIFAPVRSEIEKNYRPIAPTTAKTIETQAGQTAVKMTPAAPQTQRGPVPLGQLEAKDALARPTTPPRFSPQPTSQPKPAFVPPPPFQRTTPTPAPSANVPMSKIPPLDLSQKHATAAGMPSPIQTPQITKTAPTAQPIRPIEIKREAPFQKKDEFGFGAEIQKLERAGNELVEILKEREEQKEKVEIKTPSPKPAPAPGQPPLRQGPVMIHQESAPEPIRPSTDFKLNFPAAKPAANFSGKGEIPKMAKIEIGGTTEKQLEGVAKSSVIQPPKVVHYNAFQTPMDKPTPSPIQPPNPVSQPPMPDKKPLSQSPFVQTGKGLGDMRLESNMGDKVASGGQENLQPKKIKTVDFVDENAPIQEQKKGWFAKIFGKKDVKMKETTLSSPVPIQPTRVPITPPPVPPAAPKPTAPVPPMNIQSVKNFAGTPKEQVVPKTQDIKPQARQFRDTDVIDLNTFEIKK